MRIKFGILSLFSLLTFSACGQSNREITSTITNTMLPTQTVTLSPTATSTFTPSPTSTFTPSSTSTITPDPIPSRTPEPDFGHLIPELVEFCEPSGRTSNRGFQGPGIALILEESWKNDAEWEVVSFLPQQPRSISEIVTVICIKETRSLVGKYTDGSYGYKYVWNVEFNETVYNSHLDLSFSVKGGPPASFKSKSGHMYGTRPIEDFYKEIIPIINDPRLIFTPDSVENVYFDPKGHFLYIDYQNVAFSYLKLSTHEEKFVFGEDSLDVLDFSISPGRKYMASLFEDSNIRLWDLDNLEKVAVMVHIGASNIKISPDGTILCSYGECRDEGSCEIILWDIPSGEQKNILDWPRTPMVDLAFSKDNRLIAAVDIEGTIRLWDVETGQETMGFEAGGGVIALAFSQNSEVLGVGKMGGITLWDLETGEIVNTIQPDIDVLDLYFLEDGETLALRNDEIIYQFDYAAGQLVDYINLPGEIVGITPNWKVAVIQPSHILSYYDPILWLWNTNLSE